MVLALCNRKGNCQLADRFSLATRCEGWDKVSCAHKPLRSPAAPSVHITQKKGDDCTREASVAGRRLFPENILLSSPLSSASLQACFAVIRDMRALSLEQPCSQNLFTLGHPAADLPTQTSSESPCCNLQPTASNGQPHHAAFWLWHCTHCSGLWDVHSKNASLINRCHRGSRIIWLDAAFASLQVPSPQILIQAQTDSHSSPAPNALRTGLSQ